MTTFGSLDRRLLIAQAARQRSCSPPQAHKVGSFFWWGLPAGVLRTVELLVNSGCQAPLNPPPPPAPRARLGFVEDAQTALRHLDKTTIDKPRLQSVTDLRAESCARSRADPSQALGKLDGAGCDQLSLNTRPCFFAGRVASTRLPEESHHEASTPPPPPPNGVE